MAPSTNPSGEGNLATENTPSAGSLNPVTSPHAESTAEYLMRTCHIKVPLDNVLPSRWGEPVTEESDMAHITTWIAKSIRDFETGRAYDHYLFDDYKDDYEGWTLAMFQKADKQVIRMLKTILRYRGLYTGRNRAKVAESLYNVLTYEEAMDWDLKELIESEFDPKSRAYKRQQTLLTGKDTTVQNTPLSVSNSVVDTTEQPALQQPLQQPVLQQPLQQPALQQPLQQPALQQPHQQPIHQSIERPRDRSPYIQRGDPPHHTPDRQMAPTYNPYRSLPPRPIQNERLDPQAASTLIKNWDKENRYTGEVYDLLDDKMKIFLNECFHIGIQESQFHAVFPRILTGRAQLFYIRAIDPMGDTFATMYQKIKTHFDLDVHHQHYYTDWTTTSFHRTRTDYPEKGLQEILQIMLDKLQLCQRALGVNYDGEDNLRTTVIKACRGVPELEMALFKPEPICEALFSDLRSSIETHLARNQAPHTLIGHTEQYYLDRRYTSRGRGRQDGEGYKGGNGTTSVQSTARKGYIPRNKICFVCKKEGCWSTKHTEEERKTARTQFISEPQSFNAYLLEYEGQEQDKDTSIDNDELWDQPEEEISNGYLTTQYLTDQAFLHQLSGEDIYAPRHSTSTPACQFLIEDRYNRSKYQGILPDTGAANISTVGKEQYLALIREDPSVKLDISTAGQDSVKFGKGEVTMSIGVVQVNTDLGRIFFRVIDAPTPFLLCLADMDRLKVYFNNTTDELIQGEKRIPILRKWGHPWFHLGRQEKATVFLTETELRRLHRRFGHPAAARLRKLLKEAGHDNTETETLEEISKFCHYCQMNDQAPRRFKFTLKDDHHFNYELYVDIMYLGNRPVLHVVDSATSFQGAKFLKTISSKETWQVLQILWINTYQGPPDIITHDAGTNFAGTEFKAEAKVMGIKCKQVPTEAHWSIGKIERYHGPLRRAWDILRAELKDIPDEAVLQMAVKAVNDTAGPDGLVPTLLVFGAYPRMTTDSPPSPSIAQRAETIQKAMKAVRKLAAERKTKEALNARNGPSTEKVLELPLQSEVLVWREANGWQGPYKIINIDAQNVTVDMLNGPTTFRSTATKPYNRSTHIWQDPDIPDYPERILEPIPEAVQPRRRGRPPGSRKRTPVAAYLSKKEEGDIELSNRLRKDGIITTPGRPFESSDHQEITDLVGRGVFKFEMYNPAIHSGIRMFKSRLVREVKGKTTATPYEKSRLVIQGYNDTEKGALLTQSPTIQRCSQRVIMAIAPSLIQKGMALQLRDITQAYPQAQTELRRTILAQLPKELVDKYPKDTLLRVIKPLYGIAEAGVHWFTTYQGHHKDMLNMNTSTYDPCLLITRKTPFGLVGMQTDDTLILATPDFSTLEEEKLREAEFRSKPKTVLNSEPLDFNGCTLIRKNETLELIQKGQGIKIQPVDIKAKDRGQQYMEQRARGAYIASICQPEASFDLSVAAQAQHPTEEDIRALNKRLQWQMGNMARGLLYVPLDLHIAKLMIFADGSFANNQDMSSQLGFVLMLINEKTRDNGTFDIYGNIIHYSSTKCKRVTRSVLASEIYGMVNGFDIGIAISTTLRMITEQLDIPEIPIVVCTDSYSLYECLVKLGTTKEKRLMIDIMALRQSYERREINEIRWIHGDDNPADGLTKTLPNKALERFINTNKLTIRIEGFVQRPI